MSEFETAVQRLAAALDALEAKVEDRLVDLTASGDAVDAARRQARAAQGCTRRAADAVAACIGAVKLALDEDAKLASGEGAKAP